MRPWARLLGRLLAGHDLDSFLTIGIAATAAVLGAFGVTSPEATSSAVLATLVLTAGSTLAVRHRLAGLDAVFGELTGGSGRGGRQAPPTAEHLPVSTPVAGTALTGRGDIGLVGVTLNRTIRNQYAALERQVRAGARVRVAVIDPTGRVLGEAARRCALPDGGEIFAHRIAPTIDLLRRLAAMPGAGERVQLRLLPLVPAFGLVMLDPLTPAGRIQVEIYSHRPAAIEPVLTLAPDTDPQWYQHFVREFDRLWADARPVPLDGA